MSEEILINANTHETRVAIVENGVLQEILVERTNHRGLVGNIYMGKVVRVLPGMQAAFVDMGLDRAAFLHLSDMLHVNAEFENSKIPPQEEMISAWLHEGQKIVVQVIKDPIGTKGARVTTRISLPARYLVFMPDFDHVAVSTRIEDKAECDRLKLAVEQLLKNDKAGGFIIRTAAEGVRIEELASNYAYLIKLWGAIKHAISHAKIGQIIHADLPLELRALRDYINSKTEKVRVDNPVTFERVQAFVQDFVPMMTEKLELYAEERPLFDLYSIEDEIQKALHQKVQLKCGGHLVFDQTEAMTTIDVNTGAFVGHHNLDETILKTNLEAVGTIARQLRIRNLGGIIIIDFIDMTDEEHKRQVLRALEKALAKDHTKNSISEVSPLGLVEMTRKRTRDSLEHVLCETCSVCLGRGTIKTAETVCYEIFRELMRASKAYDANVFLVLASEHVVERMLDEESSAFAQLEVLIGKPIKFQVESSYTQEQFDVVLR